MKKVTEDNLEEVLATEYKKDDEFWGRSIREYPEYEELYRLYSELDRSLLKCINSLRAGQWENPEDAARIAREEIDGLSDDFYKSGLDTENEWKDAVSGVLSVIEDELRDISFEHESKVVFTVNKALGLGILDED